MTTCCNQLDVCYETCGTNKYDCDSEFRSCLHGICSDINKSLGFASKVQGGFKYLACPLFLAMYCGTVKTYDIWCLTYSLLFLTPLCISLSFLLSLWIDGRHSLQHSVDSWMQVLHEQPEGSMCLRGRGEGWTVTQNTMHSWMPSQTNKTCHGYFYWLYCIFIGFFFFFVREEILHKSPLKIQKLGVFKKKKKKT